MYFLRVGVSSGRGASCQAAVSKPSQATHGFSIVVFGRLSDRIAKMFSYLRYFALICLLLVIVGALGLSYYFVDIMRTDVLKSQERQASATFTSYLATVWQHSGVAAPLSDPTFQNLNKQFFASQPMKKITIFSTDVKNLYYSSTAAYAIGSDTVRITLFDLDKAQKGQLVSRVVRDAYFKDSAAPTTPYDLVQMVVPVMQRGNPVPLALAEIYLDVTPEFKQIQFLQYLIAGSIIGTFTLMIGLLIFTASRAEAIITKQHEVNLELIAAASQAEAQSHDKSQFLASVSHELRTPLNAIIGFSEIIKNEAKEGLQKVYQDYIDDINASGRHLLSLINDILDYSKAEAGKLQMEWAETDVTKIIRNSLRMVLPRAESAQVMLVEDIPSQHMVIVTDAKKLKQVLLNLLSNAVKFTPAGGEVRCQAWSDVVEGALVVVVKDTGIGIAPKDISKVMTPFGQVDSVLSRKYEGTGLGLPLSKKFVESMGGTFTITSELNAGTTITLSFPKAPPSWVAETYTAPAVAKG